VKWFRREVAAMAVLASVVTILVILLAPAGPDIPAHLFQRAFYMEHGFSLWNNLWYAGQYDFVTYSLIYYPLAALLGLGPLAVLSVAQATAAFAVVARRGLGDATRWASWSFALLWPGVVLTGALPFALGVGFGLMAAAALQARAHRTFAIMAVLTLAASPLAFLFLALPLAGAAIVHWSQWRRFRAPLCLMAAVLAFELVIWRIFPTTGHYPFWGVDMIEACIFAVIGALCSWRIERKTVRWLFVIYGIATLAVFVVPTEIGANIARIRLAAVPIALLLFSLRRWRPVPLFLGVLVMGGWWNITALTAAYGRSSIDTSSEAGYWQPAVDWLHTNLSKDYRVEAVDTVGHWPAVYLPQAGVPVARGWFRQADFPTNDVLYHPLDGPTYVRWLHSLAVQYVVLSDAPTDYSAQFEADLLRSGESGLTLVHRFGEVSVFRVPDPQPLVSGPGQPTVQSMTANGLSVRFDQAGTYRVAIRWSPYWQPSAGCLFPSEDGMMNLDGVTPGTVDLRFHVASNTALRVFAGTKQPSCAGPADGSGG
jgi:hypothetical protein